MIAKWSYKANQRWYRYWKVMFFVSLGYLIFAIIPPTMSFGIYVGSICLVGASVLLWVAKRRIKNESETRTKGVDPSVSSEEKE